ncbi:hypothetical protein QQP08_008257 [Theobroma cacao]|nr:hypothetical protein QQP08_008257 [Theobroma cacao]
MTTRSSSVLLEYLAVSASSVEGTILISVPPAKPSLPVAEESSDSGWSPMISSKTSLKEVQFLSKISVSEIRQESTQAKSSAESLSPFWVDSKDSRITEETEPSLVSSSTSIATKLTANNVNNRQTKTRLHIIKLHRTKYTCFRCIT